MSMRPKHLLDRLLTLGASGQHDLMGSVTVELREKMTSDVGMLGARSVTSFLFLRYHVQSFKIGADILHQDGMIIVISWRDSFFNCGHLL
jgi:hypothetical protein